MWHYFVGPALVRAYFLLGLVDPWPETGIPSRPRHAGEPASAELPYDGWHGSPWICAFQRQRNTKFSARIGRTGGSALRRLSKTKPREHVAEAKDAANADMR